ncbi:GTP cyclohydrolase II [soil metagenome]
MNDRVPPSLQMMALTDVADRLDPSSPDELAAVRVDRARTELRHGRPVAIRATVDADKIGGALLVAAVETLSPSRLRAMSKGGAPLRLLLTAERLTAMKWSDSKAPLTFRVPRGVTIEQLQLLGAVRAGGGDHTLLGEPQPATAQMMAALTLVKRAQLTPALLVCDLPASSDASLDAEQVLQLSVGDVSHVGPTRASSLRRISDAHVPIAANENCTLVLFREIEGDAEHVAIIVGSPAMDQPVSVRLHSSCLTGDLLGSLRCDCGDQLRRAIDHLAEAGGVLLYLAQEGRGTGLANKLRAYRLQDDGLDTLQADRYLGFRDDERDFTIAAAMLQGLGIARINLLTNNPRKIEALRGAGIEVVDRVPLLAPVNSHNARYVQTKHDFAGHLGVDDDQS